MIKRNVSYEKLWYVSISPLYTAGSKQIGSTFCFIAGVDKHVIYAIAARSGMINF